MTNVAILGFGVVGSAVAHFLTDNSNEVFALGGDHVNIKYILDLRDFPESPFSDRIVHDFNVILNDESISTVIEVMGGSHPAYEFTVSALKAGKNVITSNKEVVANYGDEFLKLAKENGVCYRFEASVGGGIPVLSTLISSVRQNKLVEVRGILNGTTNYILTKMFTFGDSFDESLKDAQALGYAERNPDADVLGIDAARKIAILTAITTGKLVSPDLIHTEGITAIRSEDVIAAEQLGLSIKLVGRCIKDGEKLFVMVAPFMVGASSPLSSVEGVYNAVEYVGDPVGSVMFYGKGAGGSATASAVVGDLMIIMCSGARTASPTFVKSSDITDFGEFTSRSYVALKDASRKDVERVFGNVEFLEGNECAFVTCNLSEYELQEKLSVLTKSGISLLSRIRLI